MTIYHNTPAVMATQRELLIVFFLPAQKIICLLTYQIKFTQRNYSHKSAASHRTAIKTEFQD